MCSIHHTSLSTLSRSWYDISAIPEDLSRSLSKHHLSTLSLSRCKSIFLCLAANIHLSLALSNSRSHSSSVSDTLWPCFLLVLVLSMKHRQQSLCHYQSLTCLCSFCLMVISILSLSLSLSLSKSRSQSNNYPPLSECTILSRRSCAESIASERVVAREVHSFANLFLPRDIFSSVSRPVFHSVFSSVFISVLCMFSSEFSISLVPFSSKQL